MTFRHQFRLLQSNPLPLDKIKTHPTFYLIVYFVSLGNTTDYGGKIRCEWQFTLVLIINALAYDESTFDFM